MLFKQSQFMENGRLPAKLVPVDSKLRGIIVPLLAIS